VLGLGSCWCFLLTAACSQKRSKTAPIRLLDSPCASARAGRRLHRPAPLARQPIPSRKHEKTTRIYRPCSRSAHPASVPRFHLLKDSSLRSEASPPSHLPLIYRAALKSSHRPPIHNDCSYPRLAASLAAPLDGRGAGGAVPRRWMVLRSDLALRPSRRTVSEPRSALHAPT
jgi:hypothetical protein